ncbi:MAG: hypothetical protein KF758_19180 [Anaerolineales bacterium]|nr:hypothetical protein [Anaerolineales bacterium]
MSKLNQIWTLVCERLQAEMPQAAFDTWIRDTEIMSHENKVIKIVVRNGYARDWIQSRVRLRIQQLLMELFSIDANIQFVVSDQDEQESDVTIQEPEVVLEPVQWLDYERIVQPHKQVVVKGYLRRLGMEIGPKAIWLYIGFHQAAWRVHNAGKKSGLALHSQEVMRFSGLSFGAFWRCLRHPDIQSGLVGLVQRIDQPHERHYRRGRDGRPHRRPVRYQVSMTPRLTRSDASILYTRLKTLLDQGETLPVALKHLIANPDVMELLEPMEVIDPDKQFHTVMDMVIAESGEGYSSEVDHLAQELQRKIINSLGNIHIPHYFILETIKRYHLTPAQAWIITVARDMAYLNTRTGERREVVTFKRGYEEMAALINSQRYKTVQAWLSKNWKTQQRGGDLTQFLIEIQSNQSQHDLELQVANMPRTFQVLLDEPIDAIGMNNVDAHGRITLDANESNSQTHLAGMIDAGGMNIVDADGTDLNSLKHRSNTNKNNTATTQHRHQAAGAVPKFWELKTLLQQNDIHPKVQKELLEVQASVHALVSWVLYAVSPQSGKLFDPLGYAISRVREHPFQEARGVFRQLADLPPAELLQLINATQTRLYDLPTPTDHPLEQVWQTTMGFNNSAIPLVRTILFGNGANE